ncbi:MAG: MFS transporter [Actinomycetales bacterium]
MPAPHESSGRRLALIGIITLVTFIAFDTIGVATAMPAVGADLDAGGAYSLAFSMFMAAALAGQGAAGGWVDAVGPGRPLLVGVVLFVAGMIGCALAPTLAVLLLSRSVSGVGGGMVTVTIYVIIAATYTEADRPRVFGYISAAWVLPALVGPGVAGWLATNLSWRAVFWVGVPFAVLAGGTVLRTARIERPAEHDVTGVRRRAVRAVLLATAVAVLPWAVQSSGALVVRVLAGGCSAVAIVVVLPRLLPPGTLRGARGLPAVVAFRAVVPGAYFGAETYIPLALHSQRGMSLTAAGLVLTAASLGWALGAWLQGRDPRAGVARFPLLVAGAVTVGLGVLALPLVLWPQVTAWVGTLIWALAAIGMGLSVATTSVLAMVLSPSEARGRDGASLQLADGLGSVVGIGIGGAIYAGTRHTLPDPTVFSAIWLVLGVLPLIGVPLALRVRGASTPAPAGPSMPPLGP